MPKRLYSLDSSLQAVSPAKASTPKRGISPQRGTLADFLQASRQISTFRHLHASRKIQNPLISLICKKNEGSFYFYHTVSLELGSTAGAILGFALGGIPGGVLGMATGEALGFLLTMAHKARTPTGKLGGVLAGLLAFALIIVLGASCLAFSDKWSSTFNGVLGLAPGSTPGNVALGALVGICGTELALAFLVLYTAWRREPFRLGMVRSYALDTVISFFTFVGVIILLSLIGVVIAGPLIYFPTMLLFDNLGWGMAVIFWSAWLTWLVALWLYGVRRQRQAQNPLQGLLSQEATTVTQLHRVRLRKLGVGLRFLLRVLGRSSIG